MLLAGPGRVFQKAGLVTTVESVDPQISKILGFQLNVKLVTQIWDMDVAFSLFMKTGNIVSKSFFNQ